jgi:hypothetical protein
MVNNPRNPQLEVVDRSGYPLQMAIAHLVEKGRDIHGWRVLYEEHAWKHKDGEQGFIDIVLENENMQVVLVVECKRIQNKEWVLLPTDGNAMPRRFARGYRIKRINGSVAGHLSGWSDEALEPKSPEAAFCVMPKDARDPSVEQIGAELVTASEALELEERGYLDNRGGNSSRVYFPAIVTTAQLKVCSFDPKRISLADGLVPADAKFEVVDYVRFTKQLSTESGCIGGFGEYGQEAATIARAKTRTAFVVSAPKLDHFLRNFLIDRH